MAPRFDAPPSPNSFSKPKPRPPKSPAQVAHIRVRNRRREYLERNPDYFKSAEHEFADPLLYDSLVRQFFSPAERQAEGQEKGYSRTLESSLLRGEARLAKLASADESHVEGNGDGDGNPLPTPAPGVQTLVTTDFEIDAALAPPATTKEEGRELWEEFLKDRFVRGGDEDFEYRIVDENDELDSLERKDREEEWFDTETPSWGTPGAEGEEQQQQPQRDEENRGDRPERMLHGETGVQDF